MGDSQALKDLISLARRTEREDSLTVLIDGETGTGRTFSHMPSITRAFGAVSVRLTAPCSPATLELRDLSFSGPEKEPSTRPSTGRTSSKSPMRGCCFWIQAMLLRVLDGGEETRVGAGKPFTSNVSLIAATNRDLLAEVQAKRFREDLFEKLRQIHLRMPPPRERTGDIPLLAAHFVAQLCAKHAALIQALRKPAVPSGIPRGGFRLPYNCGSSNSFFACRRRGSERSGNFVSSFEPVEFQLDRNRMTEAVR